MRTLVITLACLVAVDAWGHGREPEPLPPLEDEVKPPLQLAKPLSTDWQWLATDGVRPDLWVTHPPLEFAVDVLGVDALQRCALALEDGKAACALQLSPCQRLVLPNSGRLRLELDSACMAQQARGVRLQLVTPEDT